MPTVVVPNVLLVKDDMDGNTACVLTKALFDHKADLVKVNKAADGISLDTARETDARTAASRRQAGPRRPRRGELTASDGGDRRRRDRSRAAYEDEKPARQLTGWVNHLVTVGCVLIGLFALYQVFFPLAQGNQVSLILFLAAVLPLTLLCYRSGVRLRRRRAETTNEAAAPEPDARSTGCWPRSALVACLYPVLPFQIGDGGGGFDEFLSRQGTPAVVDVIVGTIVLLLVLEACRRTTGAALPIVCLLALGYAYYGGYLPQGAAIAHAGVDWGQIISASFIQSTGLYGVPLDVAATYIVLFTIYGAVLDASGASRFFIDLSFSAFRRSRAAPGRTVTLAGFLLGSVSGSGTATTVSLGSVTWPVLRRAGYPSENAGGMLAAAGIGAILSPPTLGAAAFIIAEYLGVPYLTVLVWAIVPTILYYLGILLAVEIDARRYGTREVDVDDAVGLAAAGQIRLPPDLAGDDRRVPRDGRVGVAGGRLRHRRADRAVVPGPRTPAHARRGSTGRSPPGCGACCRSRRCARPPASSRR